MSAATLLLPSTRIGRQDHHHHFVVSSFPPAAYRPFHSAVTPGTRRQEPRLNCNFRLQCSILSTPLTKELSEISSQNGIHVLEWHDHQIVEDAGSTESETLKKELSVERRIKERVEWIRSMLESMEDGEISISPYDTAWVALVEDINGSGGPQFPAALDWIAQNQLPDGSWSDGKIFEAHDRILNTLGCVIALKHWNIHSHMIRKGLMFIRENIQKLEEENAEHMPIGFEVAFPSLIEMARKLNIDIPDDAPIIQQIYDRRNLKLTRIPMDILHSVPTTLLHSLEGMPGLDWQRLISLKFKDGSFLFSPSSTAYAFMQTKDTDCLAYLTNIVKKFKGGVPNVYPVDLFEHIWAVDRLQRLGISRYFHSEIKDCVDYVHRYWTDKGISWARNSRVYDIDDTAMGFRVLRLHGYNVSADVFENFKKGDEFFCFAGQSNQAVTGMFNLYRASQVMFPKEKILANANKFSSEFLRDKRAKNELLDKWIITKDLPGEVGYALDFPWYASLPRVETRMFLEQYGGEDDVWIGKTLYRMSNVNNNIYLELGKLDYNNCQALHQLEWARIQIWYRNSGLGELGLSERSLLLGFYLAAASIFEPERSKERIAWAKTTALINATKAYFKNHQISPEDKTTFLQQMQLYGKSPTYINGGRYKPKQRLVRTLLGTLNQLNLDAVLTHGGDILHYLRQAWENWLLELQNEGSDHMGKESELIVGTLNLCAARYESLDLLMSHPKYQQLLDITNRICLQIGQFQFQHQKGREGHVNGTATAKIGGTSSSSSIDSDMQVLVELVLTNSPGDLDADTKNTFLTVAKSYYYTAHCNPQTINSHIAKVLFDRMI
ncbi:OLC1v1007296C3 [Oldenlandia corymbosa var. corymbosa]|uniref:OLC1v1007296C3 n=1 Tax=Oldenlandia corymbosa var. corymbosa TaxID=529605 RepID=A0AAV1DJB8_OLDCO|nr:OLC1v1007296C3 [Oldenlandia corymbosa var. corymbosa]